MAQTRLQHEQGQIHQVWTQDLTPFWRRKRAIDELGKPRSDVMLGFSIPTVLYPELKARWGIDLLRLTADDRRRLFSIVSTHYPHLVYERARTAVRSGGRT